MREVDTNLSPKADRFLLKDSVIDSLAYLVDNTPNAPRVKKVEVCSCQSSELRQTPHNTIAKNGVCQICEYCTFFVEENYPHLVSYSAEFLESKIPKTSESANLADALFYLELKSDLDYLENLRLKIEGKSE